MALELAVKVFQASLEHPAQRRVHIQLYYVVCTQGILADSKYNDIRVLVAASQKSPCRQQHPKHGGKAYICSFKVQ